MLSPAETGPNETAHTPHLPPVLIKVNGTTPASQMGLPGQTPPHPPGFSSAGASSSLAGAGGCPSARRPPEQRLRGDEKWAWLASIGCASRRGGGKTRGPGDTRARAHSRCAAAPVRLGSALQITADGFAGAHRRTSGACKEVSAARAAPRARERGWGGGRVRPAASMDT
ncbi:serine-rich and transmembrane domain-containing protein 1 isoform X1 [Pteropus alecto]|uniref:serine-rich and transmembrane domain-containing protein 1 isoform X1 n=1 Tax=Pteropus alecto TaxID=9402 RepID=UPI000D53C020|nr:serine-rich and transmembrane domain-containing protein 1 isoform X1 [Pteropus alecto]